MDKKYLIFGPYKSGLGNVIMSYECALAIAHITNRTLVLPPTVYLTHISKTAKEGHHSWWDIFDRNSTYQEFDILEYYNVPELAGMYEQIQSYRGWFDNFTNVMTDCYAWTSGEPRHPLTSGRQCFVNNPAQFADSKDYKDFTLNRNTIIDINRPEKYLVFNDTLFQNFYSLVYPGGPAERNALKNKINRVLRYNQRFYDLYEQTPISKLKNFNAVHVRRGDFFVQFSHALKSITESQQLTNQLERIFDVGQPLYIATDEVDQSFFDPVRKLYRHLHFYQDHGADYSLLERAIVDQIICSRANIFLGIQNSTFSRRINVMRGLEGREAKDHMGINNLDNPGIGPEAGSFPWHKRRDGEWSWNMSSYLQWTQEDVS